MITEYKFNITITLEDGDESTYDEIKVSYYRKSVHHFNLKK